MLRVREILLTGASGYVGGRLLAALHHNGFTVRCLARNPASLESKVPAGIEVVQGDVLDAASLRPALQGIDTAYYLVHSMGSTGKFEEQDRTGAQNFGAAALAEGVKKIVYLGGLGEDGDELSAHISSRQEVGEILRASGVPVVELRASIVIGSGSLSFEMIRSLVERLPVMITPKWVTTLAQPIAISDVVEYLMAVAERPFRQSKIYEIGGPDVVSYGDLMHEYARQRGLKRYMIPVPFLSPRLSSLWLALITPLYARVGRKLIDSLRCPTVVKNSDALHDFLLKPKGVTEAIRAALKKEDREFALTRWSDALSSAGEPKQWGGVRFGQRLVDSRTLHVDFPPEKAFAPIARLGGETGWYFANWLWWLRGYLDLLAGGVGMRRGRVHPHEVRVGDALDFWRVEAYVPNRKLRLSAEMKLPGRAWLEFEVLAEGTGSVIRQTAIFDPIGLFGLAYWYLVYPLHQIIFRGMLRSIASAGRKA